MQRSINTEWVSGIKKSCLGKYLREKIVAVIQYDGNSFCEYVIFDKAKRYEDNILNQIYQSKNVWNIIMMIFIFYNIKRKCLLTQQ